MWLGVALDGTGWHPASWREESARPSEILSAAYWVDLARAAEGAGLDFLTIEDSLALQSSRAVFHDDRTDLVRHTVRTVTENLAVGACLVVAILLVFLRNLHAAFAVAMVIPLSLLFAFVLMDARGVGANLISLGSIDFGIIIDSAVVLVEALMVRLAVGAAENNPVHSGYA